ncbi:MAG: hypothetical protein WDN00_01560 [Limisphaerales bacterium]
MKLKNLLGLSSALCLCVFTAQAQETNEVEQLKQQVRQMQENFEKMQAEQQRQIAALQQQLEVLSQKQVMVTNVVVAAEPSNTNAVSPDSFKELSDKVEGVVEAQKKTFLSEFNPAIGVVGESIFSYDSKPSDATGSERPGGFDVWLRSLELNISASVDPFFKAYTVINASADSATGDANLGVEEAAIVSTSLPWNLTATAGMFFGEFGRLSDVHDHELPFVNRPLVLDQYVGGESKTEGVQLNWLFPTEHYISLTGGVGTQFGDDPNDPGTYRDFNELNFWGRLSTYFDLTPNWQMEGGISGLWNPKTDNLGGLLLQPNGDILVEKERRLAGVDIKFSYVPLTDNQFQRFDWGTEILYSDNRYLNDLIIGSAFDENVGSLGLYSYVNYKWSRQLSAGFLFDWVQDDQNNSGQTFAYSPYVTLALSHWNELRLQYTHTSPSAATGQQTSDAVYLQWTWIIGSHSHGWQQH